MLKTHFLGALCFAELGTVVPRSGAEYAYLFEAFSKQNKFWGPLPAFLLSWVFVLVLRPAEIAVIVLTFAEYSIQPLMPVLGMTDMSFNDQQKVIKLIALLGLGIFVKNKFMHLDTNEHLCSHRHHNLH